MRYLLLAFIISGTAHADSNDEIVKAATDRDELESKVRAAPKVMQSMLSARICWLSESRKNIMNEIATQRKYGRIGGTVNIVSLYDLQQLVRSVDDDITDDKNELASLKLKQLSCAAEQVHLMRSCAADEDWVSACKIPLMSRLSEMIKAYDDQLNGW